MSQPFNKVKTGILMTTLGSIVAIFSGLILYLMPASIFNQLFSYSYYSLPGMTGMSSIMRTLYLFQVIGGCIAFAGSILARSNPRNGAIIAIMGSIVGAGIIISLIGGIFLYQGSTSSTPAYLSRGKGGEMRQNFPDRKSCPVCRTQIPGEAKFCPNCGDPFV
jgi:hypothetical protein